MVVAHMKIVAMNAEGRTIHATFNSNLNNKQRNTQSIAKEMFAGLHLSIIEEGSTCAQALFRSKDY